MNILPLVISLILILSYSSFTLLKERKATHYETTSYSGHTATLRSARNAAEEDLYRGWISTLKSNTAPTPSTLLTTAEKRSPFELKTYLKQVQQRRSCAFSTLNLTPLKKDTDEDLIKIPTKLLDLLYGHAYFYQEAKKNNPHLASELITYIVTNTQDDFVSLLEQISPYLELLYKMIKGTNHYNLEKKQGYPPLEDFFSFDEKRKSLLEINFASHPLLLAIFDEKIVEALYKKEQEKWMKNDPHPYVKQEELNALILDAHVSKNPLDYLARHIGYSTQPPKKNTLTLIDPSTKIKLKQEVLEWELNE